MKIPTNSYYFLLFLFLISPLLSLGFQSIPLQEGIKLYGKGVGHYEKKEYQEAIILFEEASSIFKYHLSTDNFVNARLKLSFALVRNKDYKKALDLSDQSLQEIQLFPDVTTNHLRRLHFDRGVNLYEEGFYEKSIPYLHKASEYTTEVFGLYHNNTSSTYNWLGRAYRHIEDFSNALEYGQMAVDIAEKALEDDYSDYINSVYSLAKVYDEMSNPIKSLTLYEKALDLSRDYFGENSADVADCYLNIGGIYEVLGNYSKALAYNKNALTRYKLNYGEKHNRVASCYNNIGNLLESLGDYEQSKIYRVKALDLKTAIFGFHHPIVAKYFYNLAGTFQREEKYELALENYFKSLKIQIDAYGYDHSNISRTKRHIGYVYFLQGNNEKALEEINQALAIQLKTVGKLNYFTPGFYEDKSEFYLAKGDRGLAESQLKIALSINKQLFGNHHPNLCYDYNELASLAKASGDLSTANGYNLKALNAILPEITAYDQLSLAHIDKVTRIDRLIETLQFQASLQEQNYHISGNEEFLRKAYDIYTFSTEAIDRLRNDFYLKRSIKETPNLFLTIYEKSIDIALQLWEKSSDNTYYQQAFNFSEFSKAMGLMVNFQENYAINFAGVPSDFAEKENDLQNKLEYFRNKILYRDVTDNDLLTNKVVNQWRSDVITIEAQIDSMLAYAEKNYPDYHNLKYASNMLSINKIQNEVIKQNDLMVEYFVGENHLFIFGISKNEIVAKTIAIDSTFSLEVNNLRKLVASKNNDPEGFAKVSHSLYSKLIAPLDNLVTNKDLTIITDGILGYLPFDLLIRKNPAYNQRHSFYNLDYLIRQNQIGYAYSANTIYHELQKKDQKITNFLAIAPVFEFDNSTNSLNELNPENLLALNDPIRDELMDLPGIYNEVDNLSKYLVGNTLKRSQATESAFKNGAKNYSILHLATHAIVDDLNPMNSRLIFSQEGDSIEDGNLFVWELYNMNLNADMAVLSACNTGYGQIQQGEGVMSLGRAFSYAGCKSIVMSLWPAHDGATTEIMNGLYAGLSQGMNKHEAIRKAKLDFLENNNELMAHPFYWSSFVVQGSAEPINVGKSSNLKTLLIIICLILLVFGLLASRKRLLG